MNSKDNTTVYIIDDDQAVLDSLSLLMRSAKLQAECFNCAKDFINAYKPGDQGCLLLDIRMPDMSGIELQHFLKEKKIDIPILFMTGHGDIPMAVSAIKDGAKDFIQKPFQGDELLKRIRLVLHDLEEEKNHSTQSHDTAPAFFDLLTAREKQVYEKIIEGKANKAIAIELGISQRTVEIHRAHIMQKTQSKNLTQLIKKSLQATT